MMLAARRPIRGWLSTAGRVLDPFAHPISQARHFALSNGVDFMVMAPPELVPPQGQSAGIMPDFCEDDLDQSGLEAPTLVQRRLLDGAAQFFVRHSANRALVLFQHAAQAVVGKALVVEVGAQRDNDRRAPGLLGFRRRHQVVDEHSPFGRVLALRKQLM